MNLIPMLPILEKTSTEGYAQGAFNVTCFPQLKAVLETHEIFHSPAIVQIGNIALGYLGRAADMNNSTFEEKTRGAENIVKMLKLLDAEISVPVALHADHVKDFATIKMLVEKGFTSVMIDGSHLSFDENVDLTREVVRLAHPHGVTVEGELGVLAGTEDKVFSEDSTYTNPLKVVEFIKKTGTDCLALSYGTKHGVKKGLKIKLRREIVLAAAENLRHERLKAVLVSHGSSTVPSYLVEDINALGGKLEGVGGIPLDELKAVIAAGIGKINIDTDIRLAVTRNLREYFSRVSPSDPIKMKIKDLLAEKPQEIDFRLFLQPIQDFLTDGSRAIPADLIPIYSCLKQGTMEIVGTLLVQFGSPGKASRIAVRSLEEAARSYA